MSLVVCRFVAALWLTLIPSAVSSSNNVASQTLILENSGSKPVAVTLVPEPAGKLRLKPADGDPVTRLQDGTVIASVPPSASLRIPAELSGSGQRGPTGHSWM